MLKKNPRLEKFAEINQEQRWVLKLKMGGK
jgi:hypothetical protein